MLLSRFVIASAVLAIAAAPAAAATNLIKNGSFELGAPGIGNFTNFTRTNTPTGVGADQAASIIVYNSGNSYPTGAYGEAVTPDNSTSASPDAVGGQAGYFVGDFSVDETVSQLTYLGVGNYRVGFSYYLTANGLANVGNSSFKATIIGVPVASTLIDGSSVGRTWFYATGVAQITLAGHYRTSFIYSSNAYPSKDIVIDRAFAITTTDAATVLIPPTPAFVPEPGTWSLLIAGFAMAGVAMRRRKTVVAA